VAGSVCFRSDFIELPDGRDPSRARIDKARFSVRVWARLSTLSIAIRPFPPRYTEHKDDDDGEKDRPQREQAGDFGWC
jgi:hypothetical protein